MKNNLKQLRKSKSYTQIAIQMKTGIEQSLLSKFENGERTPPTETLLRLADFYNVSIDYILCRTKNPNVNKKEPHYCGSFLCYKRNDFKVKRN